MDTGTLVSLHRERRCTCIDWRIDRLFRMLIHFRMRVNFAKDLNCVRPNDGITISVQLLLRDYRIDYQKTPPSVAQVVAEKRMVRFHRDLTAASARLRPNRASPTLAYPPRHKNGL